MKSYQSLWNTLYITNKILTAFGERTQNFIFNVLYFFFSSVEMQFTRKEKVFEYKTEFWIVLIIIGQVTR